MPERWVKWGPIDGLSPKYYVESISDTLGGFEIIFSAAEEAQERVKVVFGDSVHAYRSTNESFRQEAICALDESYGAEFYSKWTFFQVANSEYLKWLSTQSYGISDTQRLVHFSFLAVDSVVDVIAAYEPTVELLQ